MGVQCLVAQYPCLAFSRHSTPVNYACFIAKITLYAFFTRTHNWILDSNMITSLTNYVNRTFLPTNIRYQVDEISYMSSKVQHP